MEELRWVSIGIDTAVNGEKGGLSGMRVYLEEVNSWQGWRGKVGRGIGLGKESTVGYGEEENRQIQR